MSSSVGGFGGVDGGKDGGPARGAEPGVGVVAAEEVFEFFQAGEVDRAGGLFRVCAVELSGGADAEGFADVADQRIGDGGVVLDPGEPGGVP